MGRSIPENTVNFCQIWSNSKTIHFTLFFVKLPLLCTREDSRVNGRKGRKVRGVRRWRRREVRRQGRRGQ